MISNIIGEYTDANNIHVMMIAFSSVGLFSDIVLQQANFNVEDVDS